MFHLEVSGLCVCLLGWWFVNVDEEQGWVPGAYLEPADGSSDEPNEQLVEGQGTFSLNKLRQSEPQESQISQKEVHRKECTV